MLLGDLLARFTDETVAEETILAMGDLPLAVRVHEAAAAAGLPLGAYAASAMRRYAAEAADDEWVTLVGALSRAANPGAVCLQRALAASLRP